VEIVEGLVYAASGGDVVSYDPVTLEEVQRLSLGQSIFAWRRDGASLFALTADDALGQPATLRAIDLSGLAMVARGSLLLPKLGTGLFVGDGVAWIGGHGASSFADAGLMTVDVTSPDHLTLISDVDNGGRFQPQAFALNGSGLGIFPGANPLGKANGAVGIVNTSNPANTGEFFTQFDLPQPGEAVAIASGLAYVADGNAGLQVVN